MSDLKNNKLLKDIEWRKIFFTKIVNNNELTIEEENVYNSFIDYFNDIFQHNNYLFNGYKICEILHDLVFKNEVELNKNSYAIKFDELHDSKKFINIIAKYLVLYNHKEKEYFSNKINYDLKIFEIYKLEKDNETFKNNYLNVIACNKAREIIKKLHNEIQKEIEAISLSKKLKNYDICEDGMIHTNFINIDIDVYGDIEDKLKILKDIEYKLSRLNEKEFINMDMEEIKNNYIKPLKDIGMESLKYMGLSIY